MAQGAENIIVNDDLLSKYFSGEALPEEAMAIDEWKARNETNRQEFAALWNAWNVVDLVTRGDSPAIPFVAAVLMTTVAVVAWRRWPG